jgi:hypothetical protein
LTESCYHRAGDGAGVSMLTRFYLWLFLITVWITMLGLALVRGPV